MKSDRNTQEDGAPAGKSKTKKKSANVDAGRNRKGSNDRKAAGKNEGRK
jgi:hypothetical protein